MKKTSIKTARFVDNGDGTITDTTTGLMWAKGTLGCGQVTHAHAIKACSALRLAGHKDWRLPTVEEHFALADRNRHNPAIDINLFPDTKSDWYWTSTLCGWAPSCAWFVYFYYGDSSSSRRSSLAFVRAVRSVKTP